MSPAAVTAPILQYTDMKKSKQATTMPISFQLHSDILSRKMLSSFSISVSGRWDIFLNLLFSIFF